MMPYGNKTNGKKTSLSSWQGTLSCEFNPRWHFVSKVTVISKSVLFLVPPVSFLSLVNYAGNCWNSNRLPRPQNSPVVHYNRNTFRQNNFLTFVFIRIWSFKYLKMCHLNTDRIPVVAIAIGMTLNNFDKHIDTISEIRTFIIII